MPSDDARAVLESALLAELTDRHEKTRGKVRGSLNPGDRRTVWLDGQEIGTVSKDRAGKAWKVVNRDKFLAWVLETYPEATTTTTTVSVVPAWEKELLAHPVDAATGEVPPGVDEVETKPRTVVKPNDTGRAEAVRMFDGGMPELEESPDE